MNSKLEVNISVALSHQNISKKLAEQGKPTHYIIINWHNSYVFVKEAAKPYEK